MKKILLALSIGVFLSNLSFSQHSWNMTYHDNYNLGDSNVHYNDLWGYVDSAGREYAIFGSNAYTIFLDVTNPDSIVFIDTVRGRIDFTIWRDFKTWDHYAFGVSDGFGGSLQIFDLQYLPDSVVKIYDEDTLGQATHNIQMWRSDLYMVANSGLDQNGIPYQWPIRVVSVKDPYNPKTVGGWFKKGYNLGHDLFVWHDTVYLSVYASGNKDGLHVIDFTSPAYPFLIGSYQNYPEAGICHASWGTWDRQSLILADETHGSGLKMIDISDPTNMSTLSVFRTFPGAIAHNPFIVDTLAFVSYYHDGVQVWSIADPTNPVHVGYWDTDTTIGGGSNYQGYEGCWGVYPFLPSGTILATDQRHGLFTLTLDGWNPPPPPPLPVGLGKQELDLALNVYPNPANGKVTISLDNSIDQVLEVEFYSIDGDLKLRSNIEGKFGIYDFDLSDFSSGLYLVRVSGDGFEKRSKLILE